MNYPTWSDLNKPSIVPPLGTRQAPSIGPVAVMVSTEPDLKYLGSQVEGPEKVPFFMGTLMTMESHKGICIAGPYIGSPYGVMLLESLIARGAEKIIVLGWCGALTHELETGDLVLVDRAICDEGTSRHYKVLDPDLACTFPDKAFTNSLFQYLTRQGVTVHRQTVWTTDAIYRETEDKVAWFKDKGAGTVEMECSALFAAAEYRKVPITGLLVVSDSLASRDWDPGFRKKKFKTARALACKSVLAFADQST